MSALVFNKALHTPDLVANLVLIEKFDNLGISILFKGGKAYFYDLSGNIFIESKKMNQMYLLDLLPISNTSLQKPGIVLMTP